jgi:formate hydrogenlyase subunit 6/NADH:ubiquinone oxidoreductase subunit I
VLISKLKEAIICFKNLRVTLPYPFKPSVPPDGFRGRLEVSLDKCIGCGACANVCPPRLINVIDHDTMRKVEFILGKCTYCARCADICPTQAITMSKEFELATDNKSDLNISLELNMVKCEKCGTAYTTQRIIDRIKTQLPEEIGVEIAALDSLKLCPNCRKLQEGLKISEAGA